MSTTPNTTPQNVTMTPEELGKLIEAEVTKALAAQPKGITWQSIRTNKWFVLITSTLAGAFGEQIFQAFKNHTFAWNTHSWGAMASAALGTAGASLYHLYLQPNSTSVTVTKE